MRPGSLRTALASLWALLGLPGPLPASDLLTIQEPPCTPSEGLPVYQVVASPVEGPPQQGTAFFFSPFRLLTAAHVLEMDQEPSVTIILENGPKEAHIEYVNRTEDVAILSVSTLLVERRLPDPIPLGEQPLEPGEEVWVSGYPGSPPGHLTIKGQMLMKQGGQYSSYAPVFPGMSGGPLLRCNDGVLEASGLITRYSYRVLSMTATTTPSGTMRIERYVNSGMSRAVTEERIRTIISGE